MGAAVRLLRHAVPHQLRDGGRHRHRPGVPVRHELVELLGVRGQHLRRPARDGGAARVLPRVDVHRAVAVRPQPAAPAGAHALDLRGEPGHRRVRVLYPRRQRLDAASGRLPHHREQGGTHRLLGGAAELDAVGRVLPYRARRLRDRRDVRARRLGLAAAPRRERGGVHPLGQAGGRRGAGVHRARHGHRRHPGQADGHPAADEDGRGRGGLPDAERGQLLAAHHRQPVRPADLPDPDTAPAQPDRHAVLERQGRRRHAGPAGTRPRATGRAAMCRCCGSPTGASGSWSGSGS